MKLSNRTLIVTGALMFGFILGYCLSLQRADNIVYTPTRSCDDIIRYQTGQLVCEINIRAEDDI